MIIHPNVQSNIRDFIATGTSTGTYTMASPIAPIIVSLGVLVMGTLGHPNLERVFFVYSIRCCDPGQRDLGCSCLLVFLSRDDRQQFRPGCCEELLFRTGLMRRWPQLRHHHRCRHRHIRGIGSRDEPL